MVYPVSREQANRIHNVTENVAVIVSNSVSSITSWLWFLSQNIKAGPVTATLNEEAKGCSIASPFSDSKLVNVMSMWHLHWQPTPGSGRLLPCLHTMRSCLAYTPLRKAPHWDPGKALCSTEMHFTSTANRLRALIEKEAWRDTRDKPELLQTQRTGGESTYLSQKEVNVFFFFFLQQL